jgi:hypothetical protein
MYRIVDLPYPKKEITEWNIRISENWWKFYVYNITYYYMMINYKLQIGHERKPGLVNLQGRVYPTHLWVKFGSHTKRKKGINACLNHKTICTALGHVLFGLLP